MPIYEYECPKCGRFEAVQKASDKPLKCNPDCCEKECPKKAQRVISASALHFKGSGFYKTDYTSSSSTGSTGSKGKKEDSSGNKDSSEKKGEAAPTSCGSGCGCH